MTGGFRLTSSRFGSVLALLAALAVPAAAQRLPSNVVPSHYRVTFTPNLAAATFTGTEEIRITLSEPTQAVVLNALELQIPHATAVQDGASLAGTVAFDHEKQQATLIFPRALHAGDARLQMQFSGVLNEQLAGLYLSKTPKRRYAVTQFEATDARRAFPCFDEPALKATFDIAAVIDRGDNAISNSPVTSDTPGPGARTHIVTFAPTKRMSTYLVALLVGDFECLDDSVDGIPLRVCGVPGQQHLGHYALEVTKFVLHFYNQYYGIPYPYQKLDQIAVPDFMAGAMENAGAIVYRDTALLLDEPTAALGEKREVAGVIAHEIAHQWFGDFVTMDWWNNVWLNEGFATWMSSKPLAAWHPEWNMPIGDVQATVYVLSTDAVASTRAIQASQAGTPGEIQQLFDGITYDKTASILNMVEQYVGADVFRNGVNAYLKAHAYGTATAEDFWNAVTTASQKPVDRIMEGFVRQPGAPLLSIDTRCEGSHREVSIAQHRFYWDPARLDHPSPERWTIPVCLRTSGNEPECVLLTDEEQHFTLNGCSPWTFANAGGRGYYRSVYGDGTEAQLGPVAHAALTAQERIVLLKDQWDLVNPGKQSITNYLQLVALLGMENSEPVTQVAWDPLAFIGEDVLTATERPAYAAWVRRLLASRRDALGFTPAPGEPAETGVLRARVLRLLAVVGEDPETITRLRALAERYVADPSAVDPSLVDAAMAAATKYGDATLYDSMIDHLKTVATPDGRAKLEYGLAQFGSPVLLGRTLERLLSPDVRNQDLLFVLLTALRFSDNRPMVWDFIKAHFAEIQGRVGSLAATGIVNVVSAFCDPALRDDARAFFKAHALDGAEVTLEQGFERADACIRVAASQRRPLAEWLRSPASTAAAAKR